eukprot:1139927-Pelagomonas_calceolata.AAC.7
MCLTGYHSAPARRCASGSPSGPVWRGTAIGREQNPRPPCKATRAGAGLQGSVASVAAGGTQHGGAAPAAAEGP